MGINPNNKITIIIRMLFSSYIISPCIRTQEFILGKPFSIKGKTQQSFAIESREDPPHHEP
jgi:hypothetical protein